MNRLFQNRGGEPRTNKISDLHYQTSLEEATTQEKSAFMVSCVSNKEQELLQPSLLRQIGGTPGGTPLRQAQVVVPMIIDDGQLSTQPSMGGHGSSTQTTTKKKKKSPVSKRLFFFLLFFMNY